MLEKDLKALGQGATKYTYDKPDSTLLERFASPFSIDTMNKVGATGALHIEAPEFTSLCPKTGQPDFAKINIDYTPRVWCVESKSLKLYLGSFRNVGEFHESCVNRIIHDMVTLLSPVEMTVKGEFTPRGGIPFWPTATFKADE